MIAGWWDDLNPNVGGEIFYYRDAGAGRFIVSFIGVPNYSYPDGTGSLTFQAILYANGKITLQYQSMDPGTDAEGLTGATIGIENPAGDDGLEVTYNAAYVHDGLAIDLNVVRWLWVEPGGGLIDPYSSAEVNVHFNAADLEGGSYAGQLSVSTNDPMMPSTTIPVTLSVETWICGDINGDGDGTNVSDLGYLVDFLFRGGTPPPVIAAADGDGRNGDIINVSDLTYFVDYVFRGGPPPVCH
jgi:hypothetical protein